MGTSGKPVLSEVGTGISVETSGGGGGIAGGFEKRRTKVGMRRTWEGIEEWTQENRCFPE